MEGWERLGEEQEVDFCNIQNDVEGKRRLKLRRQKRNQFMKKTEIVEIVKL